MKIWHKQSLKSKDLNLYRNLITKPNIFRGYKEFRRGKKDKKDVIQFEENLSHNLLELHRNLLGKTYKPGSYTGFYVRDPKIRLIHKATVVDRVVHHIVSDQLERVFDPTYIAHSYSCRKDKGTHRGVLAFQKMAIKASKNNTETCWALKCDVRKFFPSVNHKILMKILTRK